MSVRLAVVVTHPMTALHLMSGQLAYFRSRGFEVTLISSAGEDLERAAQREGVEAAVVPMEREISPWKDALALLRMARVLFRLKPRIVNAGTPKAGLIGMLAAWLARVPVRVYTLRGLRLETARGWKGRVLGLTERLAAGCAHRVLCVSPSLRRRFVELGLAPEPKTAVLAGGGSNGIDTGRYRPAASEQEAFEIRDRLGLARDAFVVGFVGRWVRDKGLEELLQAFERLCLEQPSARLLLLGDFEPGDPLPADVAKRLIEDARIVRPGFVKDSSAYYRAMDVLAFPSYREGMPNVPLEAAASGLPVAGFRATGTVDAVLDGVTGSLVPLRDAEALGAALLRYARQPELRRAHGEAGLERVRKEYARERIWEALEAEYRRLMEPGET